MTLCQGATVYDLVHPDLIAAFRSLGIVTYADGDSVHTNAPPSSLHVLGLYFDNLDDNRGVAWGPEIGLYSEKDVEISSALHKKRDL